MLAATITKHNKIITNLNPLKDLVDKDRQKEKQLRRLIYDCEVMSSSSDETLNNAHYIGAIDKAGASSDEDSAAIAKKKGRKGGGYGAGVDLDEQNNGGSEVPVKTRFEKIAENNLLVAKSNEGFVKKAGQIMAKAHILQELLDKVYQSAKNAIQVIQ